MVLLYDVNRLGKWNNLTPLMRNKWICRTTIAEQAETWKEYIARRKADVLEGRKRPCCCLGCPHRRQSEKK
ncbi:MAG: hypothetical protein JST63_04625 [Bacteroidetes bacterium]|nr:hypothetical protein [Bacteroidota bacterium]